MTKTITPPGAVKKLSVAVVVPVAATADASAAAFDTTAISKAMSAAAGLDTSSDTAVRNCCGRRYGRRHLDQNDWPPGRRRQKSLTIPIAAGAIAVIMMFLVMRRKKSHAEPAATSVDKKAKKSKKKGGLPDSDALTALLAASSSGASEMAMEDIRNDLARLANESPESLATLLSSWLAKS